ncbi:MAG: EamA family transporter [Gammaproteobacteria bacterium]|nr:EamA family transporter [Gammaproteobacteria bacterium]
MAVIAAYTLIIIIWTTTPLAIVWSGETDWFFGIAARTALGAILILPFLAWRYPNHSTFRLDKEAIKIYMMASLPILGGMTLMYWSGQYLPSGWIAVIFAMTPVMTGLLAHSLLPNSRLTLIKAFAVLVSLIGLWIIFSPNLETHLANLQIAAILVALLSVFFHALGGVLVKRCGTNIPAIHVAIGAIWLTVLGHFMMNPTALFDWPTLQPRESYAILYAATVGSVIGFLLYFYLIKNIDAMKVALIPVITPVFAILIGHTVNNEPLSATLWLGTGIVLIGLILFQWRFKSQ